MTRSDETNSTNRTGRLAGVVGGAGSAASVHTGFSQGDWLRLALLGGFFIALHWSILEVMARTWINNPNWSHGALIPLFSLYLIWRRWPEIQRAKARPFLPGLVLMILSLVAKAFIVLQLKNHWLHAMSMIGMLFGLVLYLCGPAMMKSLWLPIAFLVFAAPLPESIYTRIAYPLQEIAAQGSVIIMHWAGVDIVRDASNLTLTSMQGEVYELTVAEACSGMRLLMAFLALGVAGAYLEERPVWQRVVLVLAGVPIAVLCNVIRVAITCTMYYIDKPELGKDVLHEFTGIVMLAPAIGMLWLLSWILNKLYVESDDAEDDEGKPSASVSPAPEGKA